MKTDSKKTTFQDLPPELQENITSYLEAGMAKELQIEEYRLSAESIQIQLVKDFDF